MAASSGVKSLAFQHILAVAVVALFAPLVARADTINITNAGGVAGAVVTAGIPGSFSLMHSTVDDINNMPPPMPESLSFTTGAWIGGGADSLSCAGCMNNTLAGQWAGGGMFTIKQGSTVVFSGDFSGPVSWTFDDCLAGKCFYTLSGSITGTYNGQSVTGATTQINLSTNGYYTGGTGNGIIKDTTGSTSLLTSGQSTVPEPGTLGLMGTGFVGISLIAMRKLKANGTSI